MQAWTYVLNFSDSTQLLERVTHWYSIWTVRLLCALADCCTIIGGLVMSSSTSRYILIQNPDIPMRYYIHMNNHMPYPSSLTPFLYHINVAPPKAIHLQENLLLIGGSTSVSSPPTVH